MAEPFVLVSAINSVGWRAHCSPTQGVGVWQVAQLTTSCVFFAGLWLLGFAYSLSVGSCRNCPRPCRIFQKAPDSGARRRTFRRAESVRATVSNSCRRHNATIDRR